MIGHLGPRVSALLDGQLSPRETEEAWAHVYACHPCRDLVEREGWVKTRLAGLCGDDGPGPSSDLKGSLLRLPPGEAGLVEPSRTPSRRTAGAVALGGGAIGAAMLGVLALGYAPGAAPPADRRPPATQIGTSVPATPTPAPSGSLVPVNTPAQLVPAPLRRMLP